MIQAKERTRGEVNRADSQNSVHIVQTFTGSCNPDRLIVDHEVTTERNGIRVCKAILSVAFVGD